MSKRQKRLERIRRNIKNVSFEDLRSVLLDLGFEQVRSSGSHHMFSIIIEGESRTLAIPFRRPVKPEYVRQSLDLIDIILAGQDEDDEDDE